MKRNAKINSRKLSLICLVLTLVIAMTAIFVVTASAAEETVKITFNDKAKRTTFTTSQQVWQENGITVTNDKSNSSSNVADYAAPARFYKSSKLTIKAPANISKIEFDCNKTSHADALVAAIGNSASASSDKVTVTLDGTSDTYTIASLSGGQVQMDSITITLAAGSQACEHPNKTTTTTPADCTTDGSTKVVCDDCGTTISNTSIPALGHNYVDGTCSKCGEEEPAGYVKVTDVTTLKVGDQIVIVAAGYNKALSTTQNTNNRGAADVVKVDDVVTFGDNVEIITLEAGKKDGTFAFKVTDGYLYAASSGSNYLRTEATLSDNSSWAITISGGVATVKAQGSNTRNWLRYNTSGLFACYSSGQADISIYKMPSAEPETPVECPHTNQTTTTNPAKCESDGSTVVTCDDCGFEISRTSIPATGHVNTTETTVDSTCTTNGSVTVTCSDCGKTTSESLPKAAHNYNADGICGVCGFDKNDRGFSGRYYIAAIRTSGNYFYMTNDLGTADTKRYTALDAEATELPEFITSDDADSKAIFVLEIQEDGTYLIYAEGIEENNYLGWTSGNSGTFVAESSAKNLTVVKKDDGTFNISFDNRYLSLNGTSGNDYFAWYTGTQINDLSLIPVVEPEPECDHAPKLDYANVNLGQSLALKYYVELCEHANVADYTMKFTMNGVETTVSAEAEKYNGLYVFTLGGIAPQCMGDEIVAELIYEGTAALTKTYSVKQNLIDLLADPANADDNELKTLIYNTLAYGAEAQKYTGYKTDALVNAGYEEDATQNAQPADAHVLSALKDGATASFKSAAVEFGDVNKIIVKINAADVANVTLKVGETALTLTKVSDGVYAATTDAISALNLGAKVGFNLYVGEDLVQTLTYSVNDYASRKWDDAEMGALVKALYNYGVAATAFAN